MTCPRTPFSHVRQGCVTPPCRLLRVSTHLSGQGLRGSGYPDVAVEVKVGGRADGRSKCLQLRSCVVGFLLTCRGLIRWDFIRSNRIINKVRLMKLFDVCSSSGLLDGKTFSLNVANIFRLNVIIISSNIVLSSTRVCLK